MISDALGWIGLISSLVYQVVALPREIWHNYRFRQGPAMSTLLLTSSTAAYVSTTMRAGLQPDWFEFGCRFFGALSSIILLGQAFHYGFWTKKSARKTLSTVEIVRRYVVRSISDEEDLCFWIKSEEEGCWREVSYETYRTIYQTAFYPIKNADEPPVFFQAPSGLTGLVTVASHSHILAQALA